MTVAFQVNDPETVVLLMQNEVVELELFFLIFDVFEDIVAASWGRVVLAENCIVCTAGTIEMALHGRFHNYYRYRSTFGDMD